MATYDNSQNSSTSSSKRKQSVADREEAAKALKSCEDRVQTVHETRMEDPSVTPINSNMRLAGHMGDEVSKHLTHLCHMQSGEMNTKFEVPVKYTKFDYSNINFPSEPACEAHSGCSGELITPVAETSKPGYFSLMDYPDTKLSSTATTWSEFKQEHQQRLCTFHRQHSSPVNRHTPLVDDDYVTEHSLSTILSRLQLSKSVDLKSLTTTRCCACNSQYILTKLFSPYFLTSTNLLLILRNLMRH